MSTSTLSRSLCWLAVVAVLVSLPMLAMAAPPEEGPDALTRLEENGWIHEAPGVLKRDLGEGRAEYLITGLEGLEWEKARVRVQIAELTATWNAYGDLEVLEALEAQKATLARLDEDIAKESSSEASSIAAPLVLGGCTVNASYSADAGPGLYGPFASASASFSESCGLHQGCTYAYAYAHGYAGTTYRSATEIDGEYCGYGTVPTASAYASVTADNNCYSHAQARVRMQDDYGYWVYFVSEDTNSTCRVPLTVEISGLNSIFLSPGQCKTVTWTPSTNRPVTSRSWTWNGLGVGTGSSYSRTFCSSGSTTYTRSYTLGVTVGDGYYTASDTDTISVTYSGYPTDPCDPYRDPFVQSNEIIQPCIEPY